MKEKFERLGESLYRKGGKIYARVRVNGKQTWRSTETNRPAEARKWLKKWKQENWMLSCGIEPAGVVLHRQRVTVSELIDAYIEAGLPTRKMKPKAEVTISNELACLKPIRLYFGQTPAAAVSLGQCDQYRDWRLAGGYFTDANTGALRNPKLRRIKAGTRSVDLELTIMANVLNLATRRGLLKANPLAGRSRYSTASDIRHCREVAPTPEGLAQIEYWLRSREEHGVADVVCFLAYSGLRIGEALPLEWEAVDWSARLLHVKREKRGIMPWVPILPPMEALLLDMRKRSTSYLLFPSPFQPNEHRDASAIRHRLCAACKALGIAHVTPHGLRSYFVTQARQSGLSDAEIASLIGDKTGPAIIAHTYGDVRPDHLLAQAQRIRLTLAEKAAPTLPGNSPASSNGSSHKSSNTALPVSAGSTESLNGAESEILLPSNTL